LKFSILLADDSPTIQRLVTQMFAGGEFDIVSVSNGDAAIRRFEELRPDIVLADIYMPGKNGYEVCAYVKKHAERGDTPVVLLAGAFDAFDENTATAAGAAAHITKPFEPQALVSLVTSLLSGEVPAKPKAAAAAATAAAPPVIGHETLSAPAPAPAIAAPAPPAAAPKRAEDDANEDILGLQDLFPPPPAAPGTLAVTDAEIDRIADRVIQKLSTQVIEEVAWDVVPDITTKVLREELKRQS